MFKNKQILLISPQTWGKMHISKHHYAIELTKQGGIVFFLNPPIRQILPSFSVKKNTEYHNLYIINYSYFFPYNLIYHFRSLFNILQSIYFSLMLKKFKLSFDIVWSFDNFSFINLKLFKGKKTIYFPVDNGLKHLQSSIIKSADYIFSVSEVIINDLKSMFPHEHISFINHGLSDFYIQNIIQNKTNNEIITAYFSGNLMIDSLDRRIIKKIILENPNVNFIFIGSYLAKSNLGLANETYKKEFISFLKNSKNVQLKGILHPKKVVMELQNADLFLVLIDPEKDINKGSNSHKILEYLSIGKVIISNYISSYSDKRNLIEMVDEMHNENLPTLFKKVIKNLDYYNNEKFLQKRRTFALNNTYKKQLERIKKYLSC